MPNWVRVDTYDDDAVEQLTRELRFVRDNEIPPDADTYPVRLLRGAEDRLYWGDPANDEWIDDNTGADSWSHDWIEAGFDEDDLTFIAESLLDGDNPGPGPK